MWGPGALEFNWGSNNSNNNYKDNANDNNKEPEKRVVPGLRVWGLWDEVFGTPGSGFRTHWVFCWDCGMSECRRTSLKLAIRRHKQLMKVRVQPQRFHAENPPPEKAF